MDRERLLNSLQERIAAYDDGDAGPVLAPEALNEADQLLAHATDTPARFTTPSERWSKH